MVNTLKPISEKLAVPPFRGTRAKRRGSWRSGGIDVFAMLIGIALLSALCLARNSVWQDDFTLWKDAAMKGPYNSRAHSGLGNDYKKRGFIAEAVKEWELALSINPYYSPSHSALGVVHLEAGRLHEAEKEFLLALEYGPDYADIHARLGYIYAKKGYPDRAIEEFSRALRIEPFMEEAKANLAAVYVEKGYSYGEKKDFVRAADMFKKALMVDEGRLAAIYGLAMGYEELGLKDDALALWREYLERAPSGDPYAGTARRHVETLERTSPPLYKGRQGGVKIET